MQRSFWPIFVLIMTWATACGVTGKSTEDDGDWNDEAPCADGFGRAADGNCYPLADSDTGTDEVSGGNGGSPPVDTGTPDGVETGGSDIGGGATGGGDTGGDMGGGATGGDMGGGATGGGDMGGGATGGGDMGGGATGGGDMGGAAGGGDIGGEAGGGDIGGEAGGAEASGEDFEPTSCTSDADCSEDDCPPGGTGCACLAEIGECMPTCGTDDDCESGTVCFMGFCEPPLED